MLFRGEYVCQKNQLKEQKVAGSGDQEIKVGGSIKLDKCVR
jgi:hypothetical protein